jgi:hypothetical protein
MDSVSPEVWQTLLSIALGVGLSAAAGFRVFVPFLVMGIAANAGHLELAPAWSWIGEAPAIYILGVATAIEIVAYFVPWLDNVLDTIATPTAVVAGIIATAAVVTGMSPVFTWTLAVIAGGGAAAAVQGVTVLARSVSSVATLGIGNFTIATGELVTSILLSILAILLPIGAVVLLILFALWVWRRYGREIRKRATKPRDPLAV